MKYDDQSFSKLCWHGQLTVKHHPKVMHCINSCRWWLQDWNVFDSDLVDLMPRAQPRWQSCQGWGADGWHWLSWVTANGTSSATAGLSHQHHETTMDHVRLLLDRGTVRVMAKLIQLSVPWTSWLMYPQRASRVTDGDVELAHRQTIWMNAMLCCQTTRSSIRKDLIRYTA